jgi:acyl dehydratase
MLNPNAVGATAGPVRRSWSSDDALLYALAVGAGPDDLALVTENSEGVEQVVLPTFVALLAGGSHGLKDALGSWPPEATVHGGQSVELARPVPCHGEVDVTSRVAAIEDKGSGALVAIEATGVLVSTGERLFTAVTSLFLRGQGGFGGRTPGATRGGTAEAEPTGEPDLTRTFKTAPNQALLYRLCGDRNPLHSDPTFARRAGFDRPILHGLCTWGIAARELWAAVGPARRLAAFGGRFRAPVWPGDTLVIRAWWVDQGQLRYVVSVGDRVVVDRGHARFVATEPDTSATIDPSASGEPGRSVPSVPATPTVGP